MKNKPEVPLNPQQSTANQSSSPPPDAAPLPAAAPQTAMQPTPNPPPSTLNPTDRPPTFSLQPAPPERCELPACRQTHHPPALINAQPLPAPVPQHKARRRGRIACLPKPVRDMVNHMISNGIHYRNIAAAVSEAGFTVTERNISNWATGGYREWCAVQEFVLQNRLDQDHLVDHLRRDDASEVPEVGLQAAATRLSQVLLQKTANAADIERNLGTFSQMVDLLCRLNRDIAALQKQRDDSRRTLGPAHDPARIKELDESSASDHERFYSDPPSDSELPKPKVPPLLPPVPTSSFLAQQDHEAAELNQQEWEARYLETLKLFSGKKAGASTDPKP